MMEMTQRTKTEGMEIAYIVFRPEGGMKKFAYCIAPIIERDNEKFYQNSAVELVTDSTVKPLPTDGDTVYPVRDGYVRDRAVAIRRAREVIADDRRHRGLPPEFLPTRPEAPSI
jgi:hypothetical protein